MFRAERILFSRCGVANSRAASSSVLLRPASALVWVPSHSLSVKKQVSIRFLSTTPAPPSIAASLVKDLREKTGAPMMECKKALMDKEVQGDISKAIDWLRAKGIAKASSQTNRISVEGLIGVLQRPSSGITLVEVNSETGSLPPTDPLPQPPPLPCHRFRCTESRFSKIRWFCCCLNQSIVRKWRL
jgi:hypothetical protein